MGSTLNIFVPSGMGTNRNKRDTESGALTIRLVFILSKIFNFLDCCEENKPKKAHVVKRERQNCSLYVY